MSETVYETSQSWQSQAEPREGLQPTADLWQYLREYGKERPEVVALWCFGLGFLLGWKLKPW